MKPGSKVLYLGAANGTTVSHVSDLVGEVKFLKYFLFFDEINFNNKFLKNLFFRLELYML
jgi:fibrillarin-like rRNA methylase